MFLLLNPRQLLEMLLLLHQSLTPHLRRDNANILMSHLHTRRDEFRIDHVYPEEDEGVSRSWDMFRVLLSQSTDIRKSTSKGAGRGGTAPFWRERFSSDQDRMVSSS